MSITPESEAAPDPAQKRRLLWGVLVFAAGWIVGVALVPVIQSMPLTAALKTTLSGLAVLAVPKLFLVIAIAIMGKPGFAYLKSLVFSKLKPPAEVSRLRYNFGLVLLISVIILGNIGPYIDGVLPGRAANPDAWAAAGDFLMIVSLFILGGDFWDKVRALFVRDAKAVFPEKA